MTQEGSRTGPKESDVKNDWGLSCCVWLGYFIYRWSRKPGVEGDVQKSIQNLSTSMKTAS